MTTLVAQHPIVPRERLQFGLDGDIPRFWYGGDPFKTRFWDALSIIFPPGEKFFMTCVRDFRDQINDPKLLQDIKDFNRQEAQHGMVHRQDNDRLRQQGIDVDSLTQYVDELLNGHYRKHYSRDYTLAITSALEHFTSIFAHSLFDKRDVMKDADHRVRAMYAWHAIEEVEHKGVAYDVMEDYTKVGYFKRVGALLHATYMFPATIFHIQRKLLIQDGFSRAERLKMAVKGVWWLLKPGGLLAPMHKHYVQYYKPGYHPWHEADQPGYAEWLAAFDHNERDPVKASEQMRAVMAMA
ncbi:metal-dependent hydrolase [uncultured Aquabacterium sp.]|uniref:metal-dependent hydrolase n=1 Tax=uncultured Aquabacterium sp. TaxID=158753 RepID=UPI0030D284AA|tara:strand:+ start:1581 stop:2468 length:888 start_codon:yes stop_codon:yes gene_type:complete